MFILNDPPNVTLKALNLQLIAAGQKGDLSHIFSSILATLIILPPLKILPLCLGVSCIHYTRNFVFVNIKKGHPKDSPFNLCSYKIYQHLRELFCIIKIAGMSQIFKHKQCTVFNIIFQYFRKFIGCNFIFLPPYNQCFYIYFI